MDIFLLYLWTRLDAIFFFALLFTIFAGVAIGVLVIVWLVNHDMIEFGEKYTLKADAAKNAALTIARYASIPVLILLLVPSQKDAAIIAGGWAVKQIATSEGAQQISGKTFALINGKLDEELAKLAPKEKE